MAMTAKAARSAASVDLSEFGVENASDDDKEKIQAIVNQFLTGFEADYRKKIKEREDK
jgi:hypothetical protein